MRACLLRMTAGLAGLLGVLWFAVSLVFLQAVVSEANWSRHYVSEFANGPYGWVFALGAIMHGSGNICLSAGLYWFLNASRLRSWGTVLLALAAAGIVLTGLFPIGAPGVTGSIHRVIATLSFALELAALFLLSIAFARHAVWRRFARTSLALTGVATVASAGLALAIVLDWRPGLAERLALASLLAWEGLAAVRLLSTARLEVP